MHTHTHTFTHVHTCTGGRRPTRSNFFFRSFIHSFAVRSPRSFIGSAGAAYSLPSSTFIHSSPPPLLHALARTVPPSRSRSPRSFSPSRLPPPSSRVLSLSLLEHHTRWRPRSRQRPRCVPHYFLSHVCAYAFHTLYTERSERTRTRTHAVPHTASAAAAGQLLFIHRVGSCSRPRSDLVLSLLFYSIPPPPIFFVCNVFVYYFIITIIIIIIIITLHKYIYNILFTC